MKNDIFIKTYLNIINEGIFDSLKSNVKKGLKAYEQQKYDQAFEYFLEAARNDQNVEAMAYLAQMYDEGKGHSKDSERAYYWYKQAAYFGDVECAYNAGLCCLNGDGCEKDIDQAIRYLEYAESRGDSDATKVLNKYSKQRKEYDRRKREEKEKKQKKEEELRKIEQKAQKEWDEDKQQREKYKNNNQEDEELSNQYQKYKPSTYDVDLHISSLIENYNNGSQRKAFREMKKIADYGNPKAQYYIAQMALGGYESSVWVDDYEVNDNEFVETYLRKSAAKNYMPACFELANLMFKKGKYGEAFQFYKQSVKDYSEASYHIGVMYDEGLGVNMDDRQALKWFKKAYQDGVSSKIKRDITQRIRDIKLRLETLGNNSSNEDDDW